MGSTLAEIDQALDALEQFLPTVEGVVSVFDPALVAVLAPFQPLFTAAIKAVDIVAADAAGGKSLLQSIEDVINHLTPGQPAAPALGPDAPPITPAN